MKRGVDVFAVGVALAAPAFAGCETILDARFDEARPYPDAGTTSGADSGADSGGDAAECSPIEPPSRQSTSGATDEIGFIVVVHDVDFGDRLGPDGEPTVETVGYDIDGQCTGRGNPQNCVPPAWTDSDVTDGEQGRDNAVGKLLLREEEFFGSAVVSSDGMTTNVAMGFDAPFGILRVSDFGGLSEDDRVVVEWFVPEPLGHAALFDGSDAWPIRNDSFEDPTASTGDAVAVFRDDNAFVTRRTLVAHFDSTEIPLLNVYFDVSDVVLTATTVRDPTGVWTLTDGVLSGHSPVNDLLRVIPEIAAKNFDATLCTDDAVNYPILKSFVCTAGDLPERPDGPATAPCTQTSVGVAFDTRPASLGPAVPPSPRTVGCPPETDPANETCDSPP
jgi:hypothetical protein